MQQIVHGVHHGIYIGKYPNNKVLQKNTSGPSLTNKMPELKAFVEHHNLWIITVHEDRSEYIQQLWIFHECLKHRQRHCYSMHIKIS